MTEPTLAAPAGGTKITIANGKLSVPANPIIPFIEGDGTGPDIWRAAVRVFDAAVEKVYKGQRKIHWMEVLAGEKAFNKTGNWLPDATVDACRDYLVSIKGPLTTPIGGGIRSLNVALRQMLDLYVCLRPVRWYRIRRRQRGGAEAAGFHLAERSEGVRQDPLRHAGQGRRLAETTRKHRRAAA